MELSVGTRRVLQVAGPVLLVAGLGLFISNFFTIFDFGNDPQAVMGALAARALGAWRSWSWAA